MDTNDQLGNTMTMLLTPPSRTPAGDEDLHRYAASGDAEAFSRLVQRYVHVVYTFCMRQLGGDNALAEDVTQAVFVLLARKAGSVRAGAMAGWLFEASRYCCANARRVAARRARHETEAAKLRPERVETNTSAALEREETGRLVHEALGRLRAGERHVLLLRYFEQCSLREVGAAIGVTDEAAKQRIARALQKLRTIMTRQAPAAGFAVAGAVPQWLESHALLTAPADLVARIACGTAAAGVTATAIAKAASAAMTWFKAQVAIAAAVIVLTCGGGVVMLAQNAGAGPGGAPSAAAPAPGSAPAALATSQPSVRIDRSTPLDCLRSFAAAIRARDVQAATTCMLVTDDDESRMIQAGIRLEIAQNRMTGALRARFGAAAPDLRVTDLTSDRVVEDALRMITPDDVQISGDRAAIAMRVSQQLLALDPTLTVMQGMPVKFVRGGDGQWQVDLAASVAFIFIDNQGRPHRGDPRIGIVLWTASGNAANDVADEIEKGTVTNRAALPRTFQRHLDARNAESRRKYPDVKIPPEITASTVMPRGMVELLP